MYRPKSWKNPTEELIRKGSHSNFSNGELGFLSAEYEAGADAMLTALKEEGTKVDTSKSQLIKVDSSKLQGAKVSGFLDVYLQELHHFKGTLVFIPDEED